MELLAPWHLLVVVAVALLVLGPKELPDAARKMSRAMHELRDFRDQIRGQFEGLLDEPDGSRGDARPDPVASRNVLEPPDEDHTLPPAGSGNSPHAP